MASLTRRPHSKFWVACFTDRNGRRLKQSTGSPDRRQAQKIAEHFEDAARRKRTALQVRRVITQLHEEISGTQVSHTSLREFLNAFHRERFPEVQQSTRDFYQNAANRFVNFMGGMADADLGEITKDHIIAFRNEEAKRSAPKTVNHKVKFLKMVFRIAKRDALLADNPAEFVELIRKGKSRVRRPFTIPELKAVFDVADPEWRSMVMFGFYTGQRLGDVAALTWYNVDLLRGEIRFVTRKTNRMKILPIPSPLRRAIEELSSSDDAAAPLHPRAFAVLAKQGKTGTLSNQFANLLAQAGLREKKAHRKAVPTDDVNTRSSSAELSFHCLRHTANTMMKEAGVPQAVVMELIGHDSEQMSEVYTHVGADALKRAADALPDPFQSTHLFSKNQRSRLEGSSHWRDL